VPNTFARALIFALGKKPLLKISAGGGARAGGARGLFPEKPAKEGRVEEKKPRKPGQSAGGTPPNEEIPRFVLYAWTVIGRPLRKTSAGAPQACRIT
jgi:hypothetical protein